jgi:hypothetical protein
MKNEAMMVSQSGELNTAPTEKKKILVLIMYFI